MPGRTFLLIAILVVAATAPIFFYEGGLRGKAAEEPSEDESFRSIDDSFQMVSVEKDDEAKNNEREPFWKSWFGTVEVEKKPEPRAADNLPPLAGSGATAGREVDRRANGPPGITLGDVLRFDITPNWLKQNWNRVTTQLTDPDLHGIRVPYCSGYDVHDFTGSLSYYFNRQNRVERITMFGFMGDAEPLAALLEQRFGFKRYASVGPGLYMLYQGDRPLGVLRIEDSTISQMQSGQNYQVHVEINLPHAQAKMSEAMLTELRRLREANLL